MIVVNFAHPLTDRQIAAIEHLTGQPVGQVLQVKTHFDHDQEFAAQARDLVEAAGLSPEEWQTLPLLINLPSFNVIAALLLAELHGRTGYFPAVIRLRPAAGGGPPQYEVAEILNLQAVRDRARERR